MKAKLTTVISYAYFVQFNMSGNLRKVPCTQYAVLRPRVGRVLILFTGLLLAAVFIRPAIGAANRPNILLIVSDDQGWPDLGCMGLKPIQTPHLDELAKQGIRLTNYYVTWPACTPSRGS